MIGDSTVVGVSDDGVVTVVVVATGGSFTVTGFVAVVADVVTTV